MTILACGCVLGWERCFDCRPGLDADQQKALALSICGQDHSKYVGKCPYCYTKLPTVSQQDKP